MSTLLLIFYVIFTLFVLYHAYSATLWSIGSLVYLFISTFMVSSPGLLILISWLAISGIAAVIYAKALRSKIADGLYERAKSSVPTLSATEETALNAGDTWLEKDIFMGQPNWEKLSAIQPKLTQEEQDFLSQETEILCQMLNDWNISQEQDLPPLVWQYLKEKGFLGLVIDKSYGGKGFSAYAHSEIVMKIATRSGVAAVTVMVPNSLGPGELLQYYGTNEQKSYYLPRLAKGVDIPCFALTEPSAGSDATSIQSQAIVVTKQVDGTSVLGLEIDLDKRWITLAPVATLIGLAVNLKDPNGLLAGEGKEGITCLLIQRDTEGLSIGHRHLPAEQPFMNGTIRGKNIFVPIASIIGGQKNAGQGWQMLVECLSIGRSISLPALAGASSSVAYLATSAFSRLRRQFNLEIRQFEGVQEKLAEIGGLNYLINAQRLLTLSAVCEHKKPSVASAITKYFNTELARIVINHAMDIHGGRAVVAGPRNYLSGFYQGIPISITVEGANIMSRNLLIFGQGSMACHPYIRDEFYAISRGDKAAFHELVWKHIEYFFKNFARAVSSAWTGGRLIVAPNNPFHRQYQKLTRLSQALSWIADLSLIMLGGELKRKERLSARLADALSYLYMAMAVLREAEPYKDHQDERLHANWALAYCFYHAQLAMRNLAQNFPSRIIGWLIKGLVFPWGQTMHYPSDKDSSSLSQAMVQNNIYRERIKKSIYLSGSPSEPIDKVEYVLQLLNTHGALLSKVKDLSRCPVHELNARLAQKVQEGVISEQESTVLIEIERARWDAILVDEFSFDSMQHKTFQSLTDELPTPFDVPKIKKKSTKIPVH